MFNQKDENDLLRILTNSENNLPLNLSIFYSDCNYIDKCSRSNIPHLEMHYHCWFLCADPLTCKYETLKCSLLIKHCNCAFHETHKNLRQSLCIS